VSSLADLAGYLGTIENGQTFGSLAGDRGGGTFGGSEDHTAMLCARAGHLSQYAYRPVQFQRAIALPAGYTFAVAASGGAAEKTGQAMEQYNRASRLVRELERLWQADSGGEPRPLAAILAGSADAAGAPRAAERLTRLVQSASGGPFPAEALLARLEHFRVENEQVLPAAGDALASGDLAGFGRLVDRSQEAAETLLGNQVPETVFLAGAARRLGAVAASAFGAGFGGSVWALVAQDRVAALLGAWEAAYCREFPQHAGQACFFATAAGPAAFCVF